ncbi:MAG: AAA family ATPase, partial [Deltaproteobacteria bacterium]|nr:AAA family ATPase [Deltaproteobacteria bacterium]
MLIEFSIDNFLSYKTAQTLSLVPSKKLKEDKLKDEHFTQVEIKSASTTKKIALLKSIAIYGANASGKSNLIKALSLVKWLVANSSKESQAGDKIDVIPFLLNEETMKKPSMFELVFLIEQIPFRYGFKADTKEIKNEWLFYSPRGKEAKLFVREGDKIEVGLDFKEGRSILNLVNPIRENALFLSVCAQHGRRGQAQTIVEWFKGISIISGLQDLGPML